MIYANAVGALSMIWYDTDVTYLQTDVIHFTSSPATLDSLTSVTSELNPSLHPYIVDLAESQLWTHDGQGARAKDAYMRAAGELQFMNANYGLDREIGFGGGQ